MDKRSGSFERRRFDPVVPFHTRRNEEGSPPQSRSYIYRSKQAGEPRPVADDDDVWVNCLVNMVPIPG